jgi:hypothetical protein
VLPSLDPFQLDVIGYLVFLVILAKFLGNETRALLVALIAVTLSPQPAILLVVAVLLMFLKTIDIYKAMR